MSKENPCSPVRVCDLRGKRFNVAHTLLFRQGARLRREIGDAFVELCEPRIRGLAAHISKVNLLDDDRNLEDRKDLIKTNIREIPPRAPRIPLDNLRLETPPAAVQTGASPLTANSTARYTLCILTGVASLVTCYPDIP